MKCGECNDTGWITLLTSRKPCACRHPAVKLASAISMETCVNDNEWKVDPNAVYDGKYFMVTRIATVEWSKDAKPYAEEFKWSVGDGKIEFPEEFLR